MATGSDNTMGMLGQTGEMTAAEVLAAAGLPAGTGEQSVFFYDLFIATADIASKPREIPCRHWQAALKYRPLTSQEQAARERYFERKIRESIRKQSAAQ